MVVVIINISERHPPSPDKLFPVRKSVSSPPAGPVFCVVPSKPKRSKPTHRTRPHLLLVVGLGFTYVHVCLSTKLTFGDERGDSVVMPDNKRSFFTLYAYYCFFLCICPF